MPIVIITRNGEEEVAGRAMKSGAVDYVIKDPSGHWVQTVPLAILKAVKAKEAEELDEDVAERHQGVGHINEQLKTEIARGELMGEALRASEENIVCWWKTPPRPSS